MPFSKPWYFDLACFATPQTFLRSNSGCMKHGLRTAYVAWPVMADLFCGSFCLQSSAEDMCRVCKLVSRPRYVQVFAGLVKVGLRSSRRQIRCASPRPKRSINIYASTGYKESLLQTNGYKMRFCVLIFPVLRLQSCVRWY